MGAVIYSVPNSFINRSGVFSFQEKRAAPMLVRRLLFQRLFPSVRDCVPAVLRSDQVLLAFLLQRLYRLLQPACGSRGREVKFDTGRRVPRVPERWVERRNRLRGRSCAEGADRDTRGERSRGPVCIQESHGIAAVPRVAPTVV